MVMYDITKEQYDEINKQFNKILDSYLSKFNKYGDAYFLQKGLIGENVCAIPDVRIQDILKGSWVDFEVKESFKGGNFVDWGLHNIEDIDEYNIDEIKDVLIELPKVVDLYYNMVAEIEELLESVNVTM